MNWEQVEGKWDQFRGKAHQHGGRLTHHDSAPDKGKRTELAGRIQERYGVAKEDADKEIDAWLRKM